MPRRDLKSNNSEYPIPFVGNSDERIKEALSTVGFSFPDTNSRASGIRDILIGQSLLFGIYRPVVRRNIAPNQAFLHPEYAQMAVGELPNITEQPYNRRRKKWLPVATTLLKEFARQPEARTLVVDGIVRYCDQIARATRQIPGSTHPYLASNARSFENMGSLEYAGVHHSHTTIAGILDPALGETARFVVQDKRYHYAVRPIMRCVRWIVPGVDVEETQRAILAGFAENRKQQTEEPPLVDPQELFMLGRLALSERHAERGIAVQEVFA